jgi:hypothetical protein
MLLAFSILTTLNWSPIKVKDNSTPTLSEAEWQVWYHDSFDHDASPLLNREGVGFLKGLIVLWSYYLSERVDNNGQFGFSDFSLRCNDQCVFIHGDGSSLGVSGTVCKQHLKLRLWIFGDAEYVHEPADNDLLTAVAESHQKLLSVGRSSAALFALASKCKDSHEFRQSLSALTMDEPNR